MQESVSSAYKSIQYEYAYPENVQNNFWNIARNKTILRIIKQVNISDKKFLEIGCGNGIVVEYLRKKKINCFGVEIADVNPLTSVKDYLFVSKNAKNLNSDFKNSINTLMFFDILEHIENPFFFLQDILKHYPNTSHLIITVPSRKELWSNYDEFYGHYKRYDIDLISNLARSINGKKISMKYFFKLLYFPALISLGIFKKRNLKSPVPGNFLENFLHKFISQILFFTDTVLPAKFVGTSLICIVKIK